MAPRNILRAEVRTLLTWRVSRRWLDAQNRTEPSNLPIPGANDISAGYRSNACQGPTTGPKVQGHIGSTLLQLWAGLDGGNWNGTIKAMNGKVLSCFKEYYAARPAAGLATNNTVQKVLTANTLSLRNTARCR